MVITNFWKRLLKKKKTAWIMKGRSKVVSNMRNIYSFLQFYSIRCLLNLSWISLFSFIPLPCKEVKDIDEEEFSFPLDPILILDLFSLFFHSLFFPLFFILNFHNYSALKVHSIVRIEIIRKIKNRKTLDDSLRKEITSYRPCCVCLNIS